MDQELTQQQARKLGLPDQDPINGEPIVWAEPIPAQQDRKSRFQPGTSIEEAVAIASRILGDGAAA